MRSSTASNEISNRPLKAMQLLPALEEGGVERYVVQLNRILVGAGWANVTVSRGGRLEAEIRRDGGETRRLDLKSKNPLTALWRAWKLRRLVKRERPNVVCAHSRVPAWLAKFALKGLGVKWITFAHGANSVSRYSRVMTAGDVTLCPSTFVADYLRDAYGVTPPRVRVIPHAVDAQRFDPSAVDRTRMRELADEWRLAGKTTVMTVGRLTRLKGHAELIRALTRLPESFKLVIVGGAERGKEEYLAGLKTLAAELGVTERIVFAGQRREIPECLALADVVVSANTEKPEAFGLSMAEALAMERPVVAKAFGGALDIVRDGRDGVLVRDGDFAAAILAAARRRFGGLRDGVLTRFSYAKMTERTLAVYRELAESR